MGCMIRITRDDTGDELTNARLADFLRLLPGVTGVRVLTGDDLAREALAREGVMLETIPMGEPAISGALGRGPMFASVKQSDVDAYVERQAERMGHTEIHRG